MDENPAVIASPEGLFRRPLPADHPNTAPFIAAELAAGKTIGLITGRCEIGPRALGHRSILALASAGGMRQKINDTIKHREWWRPFAPVCLFKDLRKYFDLPVASPYMLLNAKVKPEARQLLASVTHVDGTARVQTVADDEPSLLRDILDRLEQLGFPPVLLNTSFNISGRPLINSATDALSVLLTTGLDAAWIEGSWFEKIGNATGKAAAEE